jgi:cell division protein FtsZ
MAMFKFDAAGLTRHAPRMAVVGLGGCGCKAVTRLHAALADVVTVAVNTDTVSLKAAQAMTKVRIGGEATGRAGAGGDADLGRMAAERDLEMLRGVFSDVDVAVIVVALGGGTGSGAAPVLLRAAAESETVVVVLAGMPFAFESAARQKTADLAFAELRTHTDLLVRIDNDRLLANTDSAKVAEAFETAARMLAQGVTAFVRMLASSALLTVDPGDFRRVCAGGACAFGSAAAEGHGRAAAAVERLVKSSLLDGGKALRDAPCAILSIAAADDLAVIEVDTIVRDVAAALPNDCDLIVGVNADDRWGPALVLTILAATRVKRAIPSGREPAGSAPRKNRRLTKAKALQAKLQLDVVSKGRFKDVEATILDGEDLDTPTFIRRGIEIEK